jgi:hypothetical protein
MVIFEKVKFGVIISLDLNDLILKIVFLNLEIIHDEYEMSYRLEKEIKEVSDFEFEIPVVGVKVNDLIGEIKQYDDDIPIQLEIKDFLKKKIVVGKEIRYQRRNLI